MPARASLASAPKRAADTLAIGMKSIVLTYGSVRYMGSVTITVIVVSTVAIFNDFVNPLYFLPGTENSTVQLTLFNFQSQFNTRWNLLFADVLLITVPPLILFIFFQRQFASGFTAGAVKG